MRKIPLETVLQEYIIQLAELLGFRIYHVAKVKGQLRAASSEGFYDLVLLHTESGRILFVELKIKNRRRSGNQKAWAWAAQNPKCPAEYYLWREKDWLDGSIEKCLKRGVR